jgi:hypothetical protein
MKRLPLVLPVILLLGCRAGESPGGGASVVDSAGVVIVTNSIADRAITEWSIDPNPMVRIGGAREEPGQQLYRVAGAIRLSDGRLVVANAGSVEIYYYDRAGEFVRAVGGRGGGPGEFQWLDWIAKLDGDTIVAYDSSERRVSWFDDQGELARAVTVRASSDVRWPSPVGVFDDGSLLVRQYISPEDYAGLHHWMFRLLRYDAATGSMAPLGKFRGEDSFHVPVGRGVANYGVPFGPSTAVGLTDSSFYVAHNDRFEIRFYEPSGTLRRIVRRAQPVVPVTDELADRFREAALELLPSERRSQLETVLDDIPVPETVPAFGSAYYVGRLPAVMLDEAGNLWVLEYTWHRNEATHWSIFDGDGVAVAQLTLPAGYEPLHVGTGHVVLRTRDELDVESVQVHRLVKGS